MALVEMMRLWSEGVAAADKGDWNGALKSFTSISDPRSKICFNIGCCHLVKGDLQMAEEAFTMTIERDKHLAVGYFQRGLVYFKRSKYIPALQDWTRAFTELRGNQLIDYKILGMTFKLYSCELLYNIALAHTKVGDWAKAEENLLLALSQKAEPRHNTKIERALHDILKQKDFAPVEMPKGKMFYPSEKLVEQLEKKDYLGKAQVVASVVDKDSFSGFAPLQPQANNPPLRPKTPEILRTLEGEPHRVLFEFNPETAEEIQVMPGNIVFVVSKGEDNWATIMFNGKKGIVPYNYLQPVELRFQPKAQVLEAGKMGECKDLSDFDKNQIVMARRLGQSIPKTAALVACSRSAVEQGSPSDSTELDIPAPPTANPPKRPKDPKASSTTASSPDSSREESHYIVKVYYKYTVAIQTPHKLPYDDLLTMISSKLQLSSSSIKLSFRDGEADVTLNKDNMDKAWELTTENCLKLKCTDLEPDETFAATEDAKSQDPSAAKEMTVTEVTALFDYEASQSEDLPFKKGDVIKVLSKISADWWEGECQGKVGIFPTAFVE